MCSGGDGGGRLKRRSLPRRRPVSEPARQRRGGANLDPQKVPEPGGDAGGPGPQAGTGAGGRRANFAEAEKLYEGDFSPRRIRHQRSADLPGSPAAASPAPGPRRIEKKMRRLLPRRSGKKCRGSSLPGTGWRRLSRTPGSNTTWERSRISSGMARRPRHIGKRRRRATGYRYLYFSYLAAKKLGQIDEAAWTGKFSAALKEAEAYNGHFPGLAVYAQGTLLQALGKKDAGKQKLKEALLYPDKGMSHYLCREALGAP